MAAPVGVQLRTDVRLLERLVDELLLKEVRQAVGLANHIRSDAARRLLQAQQESILGGRVDKLIGDLGIDIEPRLRIPFDLGSLGVFAFAPDKDAILAGLLRFMDTARPAALAAFRWLGLLLIRIVVGAEHL